MKRFIVHPTKAVPFLAIVRANELNPAECVNANRPEEMLGRDTRGMRHIYAETKPQAPTTPTPCRCGGVDTDGDGNCHRCAPDFRVEDEIARRRLGRHFGDEHAEG